MIHISTSLSSFFDYNSICFFQSFTVFYINIATVNGPTPPGTGVAKEHSDLADARISPQSFPPESRLIPTSIAMEPGLSWVIRFGFPTAEITISASLVSSFKF